MSGPDYFCIKCGTRLGSGSAFCTACGEPTRAARPAAAPSAAHVVAQEQPVLPTMASAYGVTLQAASLAGTLAGLPWRIVSGKEPFDPRGFAAALAPAAQMAIRASLRKPALVLVLTSALDLATAYLLGQPAALRMVLFRFGMAAVTALFGLIAGKQGGLIRKLTGVAALATALVQMLSLGRTAIAGVASPATLLPLLPSLVSQFAAFILAIKTAIVGFRS